MTRSPDVQVLGHAVLLQGRALTVLVHLAATGASEVSRRNGHISPATTELLAAVARADMATRAQSGHADVRRSADPAPSDSAIGTSQVAGQLMVSERHVRRLAAAGVLPGHHSRRGWRFRQSEVLAYQAQQERETHP